MPRVCTVCVHRDRSAIDAALVVPATSIRGIARNYGLSDDSLYRHAHSHLPAHLAQAHEAAELSDADKLLAEVGRLHRLALSILARAGQAGDLRTALVGIREARGCLELEAKIRGQLDERPVVNVLLAPEWLKVRAVLMTALLPYPDARRDAAQALMALDSGGSGERSA